LFSQTGEICANPTVRRSFSFGFSDMTFNFIILT
jgi:hypothetical protein